MLGRVKNFENAGILSDEQLNNFKKASSYRPENITAYDQKKKIVK